MADKHTPTPAAESISVACPTNKCESLVPPHSEKNAGAESLLSEEGLGDMENDSPKENGIGNNRAFSSVKTIDQHTSSSNSRSTDAKKAEALQKIKHLEKVNGLTTQCDHSSGDNGVHLNLLNACCKEETVDIHSGDSGRGSGSACHCAETDCDEVNCDELGSSKVHSSNNEPSEVDTLLNDLERASLNELQQHRHEINDVINGITYVVYESEKQMPDIMRLITKDLSEPYSIYTYRYFIHNWPKLCFLAMADNKCVGAIVCKLDLHKKMVRRGYIAMLAVDSEYRRRQIGSTLVTKAIEAMIRDDCDEVVLETEITNQGALHLYENLGFVRDKRLFRYYLNGVDALRLKLWLR